ncbi:hypothetical protein [Yoonia sp.]|uniref:hypothetical protein n=1 Tax=Yoonia sp. TaxID=2212373 RepID=UPI00391ADA40
MNLSSKLLIVAVMSLGACAEMPMQSTADASGSVSNVPDSVREIAAPFQDLSTVVFLEEDNCYWYEHQGPVETTLLPLRTVTGSTICAETAPPPAA